MAESKSVVVKLTAEQSEAVRKATGQNIGELKVEALGGRVASWSGGRAKDRKAPFGEFWDADADVLEEFSDEDKAQICSGAAARILAARRIEREREAGAEEREQREKDEAGAAAEAEKKRKKDFLIY